MRVSVNRPFGIIILLSVCVTLTFIGQTMPYPVLAPWLQKQGIGLGALGWLSFAFSLGNLIGAPFAGGLVDRWGRRPMLLIGLATIVITNAVIPLFESFNTFVILRFLLGLGNAGTMPAAIAIAIGDALWVSCNRPDCNRRSRAQKKRNRQSRLHSNCNPIAIGR